jgi:hypothetical protein
MKLIRRLLGIGDHKDAYPAIVLQTEGQGIPLFTPVIVERDIAYQRATIPFPTYVGHSSRSYILLNEDKSLLALKPEGIIQNRRVKPIDEFEFKKLKKIREFIHFNGAITFIIENLSEVVEFMKAIVYFKKEYPCTAFCGSNSTGGYKVPPVEGDNLSLAITMYDLKYAIPIYNKKKVDGMAVSITLVWPRGSEQSEQLIFVNEMHFIVSSYPDNVLIIDGVKIRDNSFISSACIALFISQINYELERRKIGLSKAKK